MAKKKIVYLLGAGASANALPTYNDMLNRMENFISIIRDFHISKMSKPERDNLYIEDRNKILSRYDTYLNRISEIGTPDAIARRCYLSELTKESEQEIKFLKHFLCSFFEFELMKNFEFVNRSYISRETSDLPTGEFFYRTILDPRYEKFISTISEKSTDGLKIPDNVSVISWNYDMQLELTFKKKYTKNPLFEVQKRLNIFPKLMSDEKQKQIPYNEKGFSILKMNGTAHFYYNDEKIFEDEPTTEEVQLNYLFNVLNSYGDGKTPTRPHQLHFAWETENENVIKARKYAKERIAEADAIVIIGYSFPDFNRIIDMEIFKNLKGGIKIYIQDNNYVEVQEKLTGLNPRKKLNIIAKKVAPHFYVPQEFWEDKEVFKAKVITPKRSSRNSY